MWDMAKVRANSALDGRCLGSSKCLHVFVNARESICGSPIQCKIRQGYDLPHPAEQTLALRRFRNRTTHVNRRSELSTQVLRTHTHTHTHTHTRALMTTKTKQTNNACFFHVLCSLYFFNAFFLCFSSFSQHPVCFAASTASLCYFAGCSFHLSVLALPVLDTFACFLLLPLPVFTTSGSQNNFLPSTSGPHFRFSVLPVPHLALTRLRELDDAFGRRRIERSGRHLPSEKSREMKCCCYCCCCCCCC